MNLHNIPPARKPPSPADLVDAFLATIEGKNANAVAPDVGVSNSQISRWRRGERPARMNPTTQAALESWIERAATRTRGAETLDRARALVEAGKRSSARPASRKKA